MDLLKFKFFSIFSVRDEIREIEKKDKEEQQEAVESVEEKLSLMGYSISQIDVSLTIPPKTSINIDLLHSKIDQEIKEHLLKTSGFFFKSVIYPII